MIGNVRKIQKRKETPFLKYGRTLRRNRSKRQGSSSGKSAPTSALYSTEIMRTAASQFDAGISSPSLKRR